MDIYMNIYMNIYIYIYIHVHIFRYTHICIWIYIYIYIHTVYVYIHICMYVYICTYAHISWCHPSWTHEPTRFLEWLFWDHSPRCALRSWTTPRKWRGWSPAVSGQLEMVFLVPGMVQRTWEPWNFRGNVLDLGRWVSSWSLDSGCLYFFGGYNMLEPVMACEEVDGFLCRVDEKYFRWFKGWYLQKLWYFNSNSMLNLRIMGWVETIGNSQPAHLPPLVVQFQAWRLFLVRLRPDQDRTSDKELGIENHRSLAMDGNGKSTFPPRNTNYRDCTWSLHTEHKSWDWSPLSIDPTSCMYWMYNYPIYTIVVVLIPFQWMPLSKKVRPSPNFRASSVCTARLVFQVTDVLLTSQCLVGQHSPFLVAQPTKQFPWPTDSIIGVCSCALSN